MSNQNPGYSFQGLSGANSGWSNLLGDLSGVFKGYQSTPYFGQAISGAEGVAGMAPGFANTEFGGAQNLFDYGGRVLNQAFDPQNALYNRTLERTTDQTNAGLAASGVGGSPYGAGIQAQNNQNFNIDWQNNKLAREQAGLGAAEGAFGQGAGLYSGGLNTLTGASAGPLNVETGFANNLFNMGTGLGTQYGDFMNQGLGFQNSQAQINQMGAQQSAGIGAGFGSLLGDVGGLFGGGGAGAAGAGKAGGAAADAGAAGAGKSAGSALADAAPLILAA